MAETILDPYDVYSDTRSKRERYLMWMQGMKLERSSFEDHWRELSRWGRPSRERFFVTDRNKGDRRNQEIIDSTAIFSLRTLQSGFQAGLTSPARPWFRLTTPDPEMAEVGAVKAWLHKVASRMQVVMLRSNLYNQLPNIYGDMGLFGTTALGAFEDDEDTMRFATYPIGSYVASMDARGRPSMFAREYELTCDQLVGEFGGPGGRPLRRGEKIEWGNFSNAVKIAWRGNNRQAPFTVVWFVKNNDDYEPDAMDERQWPVVSCYFERGRSSAQSGTEDVTKGFLRESGFRMWPVMVPRWDATAEDAYGRECPGMVALGDIKQLQKEQKRKGQALEKMINPPTTAPTHLQTQKVSLLPGDITYVDVRADQGGVRPIHEVKYPVAEVSQDILEVQYRIKTAFYEPLFLMLAHGDRRGTQPPTAREIDERHEEKLIGLGPVLERTNDELLDPLIDRIFQVMNDAGLLPPAPPEVQGLSLGVEYVSIMAQAQKLVGVIGQDRFLQSVMGMSQVWPEVRHKVRTAQVVDNYGDQLGVDPEIIRPDEEYEELVAAERQQMAQAQQAAMQQQQAQTTRELSQSSLEGDSALKRLVEGVV